MDNAVNAVNKLFSKGSTSAETESNNVANTSSHNIANNPSNSSVPSSADRDIDTTVDSEVAPAVEHTHVTKAHETREQTFVEKERHQDHYHTTIQPLKDSEVLPEKHDHVQETKERNINKDDNSAKAKAEADRAGFQSTTEQKKFESATKEPTQVNEHVHHHLHETVQPVIEKEVLDPSVTHKRVDVKEKIQERSENHGVTTNSTIPVEEFQKRLDGGKVL